MHLRFALAVKSIFALLCFSLLAFYCQGQSSIKGLVTYADGRPVVQASVVLLNARDSILIKGGFTNEKGNYLFEKVEKGEYLVSASHSGLQPAYTSVTLASNNTVVDAGPMLLSSIVDLKSITVSAKKPPFEQRIDRLVVNVQGSITAAGSSALDILEKSPGIIVDRQNNSIAMGGKDGVVIMINGKNTYMPASAIVQLLAGMNSNNIEKIELITTPPSNFDAEGNAGFINIVLKTNPDLGTNGSYSLTMGYGRGTAPSATINLNHRKQKLSLYGDYSFMRSRFIQDFSFYRRIKFNAKTTENYVVAERHAVQRNHNLRFGLDYQLSKRTSLGALASGYDNRWTMDAANNSRYFVNSLRDTAINILNDELNLWRNYMMNINLQHSFKNNDKLTLDFDRLFYHDNNPIDYVNSYYNGSDQFLFDEQTKSGKITPIRVYVGKVDYAKKLGKKTDLEAGFKATISKFNNDVDIHRKMQNTWVKDEGYSANYLLKENITAAYTSVSIAADAKTSLKFGLRYEYTTSNLGTLKEKNIIDRQYGNFFPSVFVSHKLSDATTFNFSYSRRITRPTFNELAPFAIFFDPNTFISGNAALQPSIANGFKADYMYKRYMVSIAYTHEDDVIARFQPTIDSVTNKQTLTSQNFDNRKTATLTLLIPFTVTTWWTSQSTAFVDWQQQNLLYNGSPVQVIQKNIRLTSSQNFTLPKNYSLELSGFYQSAGLFGLSVIKAFGALNFGAQKKFSKSTLRFNVTDIFNTTKFRSNINLPEYNLVAHGQLQFMPRTFRLTFTKSFGRNTVKAATDRVTGSEEERRRVE